LRPNHGEDEIRGVEIDGLVRAEDIFAVKPGAFDLRREIERDRINRAEISDRIAGIEISRIGGKKKVVPVRNVFTVSPTGLG